MGCGSTTSLLVARKERGPVLRGPHPLEPLWKPSGNPLAKFAQQGLLYPQGRWLVDPQGSSRLEVYAWTIQLLGRADCMHR